MASGDFIEISGLWAEKDKNGNPTMSGYLGNAKIRIFKNTYKEPGSKQPDYRLLIAPGDKKGKKDDSADIPVSDEL